MSSRVLLLAIFSGLLFSVSFAQESWPLQKCIIYGQQNSNAIKQGNLAIQNRKLDLKQNKGARYPNLNAGINGGFQFGRTIDPISNDFSTDAIGTNSLSLNTAVTIYNGNRIRNSIKQSEYNISAAQEDINQTTNDISLNIASAYLNILFGEEQLESAKQRLEQTQRQLDFTNRLIQAGSLPENDRSDIEANLARDEQSIVTQQNSIDIAYLSLKQLLNLEPDYDLVIVRADIDIPTASPENFSLTEIYNQAVNNQPFILAGEYNLKSANLDVKIAKASRMPSLSLNAGINSGYSNKAQTIELRGIEEGDPLPGTFNGSPGLFTFAEAKFDRKDISYGDQLNENFGQNIGARISIPIYNNSQVKVAEERARLNILNTQIVNTINKQQLKTDIQKAIADARAAKKQLEASQKTVDALKVSYQNTERKFQLGAINTFEYTTSKNNLDQAEVELIVSKYDYLFKLKIIDFYQGKKITLE